MIEDDRLFTVLGEPFVDDVEHLQERGILGDPRRFVGLEAAFDRWAFLAPDAQRDVHYL